MYSSVWTALKAILDPLITTTTLTAVYDYDLKSYESFPVATISTSDWEETYLDSSNNISILKFIIRVADQNKVVATMEARMRTLVDAILVELRKKTNCELWGIAEWMTFSIIWGWKDDEHLTRVCDITCIIKLINTVV